MFQKHLRDQHGWHRVSKSESDGEEVGRPNHVNTVGSCKELGLSSKRHEDLLRSFEPKSDMIDPIDI